MDDRFYEKLLSAIKNDDLNAFNECKQETNCGNIRFGRFPVLSVMYLYKAKKLIYAYEDLFIKYNSWQDAPEPVFLSADFSKAAKKCMRLYIDECVTPLEMLLILDNTKRVKKLYSAASPTPAVKENLREIYSIKYSLNLTCEANDIYMDKRPMTRSEKKRLLIAAISTLLCVAIIVSTPFIVNIFVPFIGQESLSPQEPDPEPAPETPDDTPSGPITAEVSSWAEIDFASSNEYILTEDITAPIETSVEELKCTLNGNGNAINFDGDAPLFKTVTNTTVTDLTINTTGKAPIFGKIWIDSTVQNLTVNANLDLTTDHDIALVATENAGKISNVEVNIKGKITAVAPENAGEEFTGISVSGLTLVNNNYTYNYFYTYYGKVQNCKVNLDNLELMGMEKANATFSGAIKNNYAYLMQTEVSGKATSDTFNIAGLCEENNGVISECINNATLTQTTASSGWNPIVSGIVLQNFATVQLSKNNADLTSVATSPKPEPDEDGNERTGVAVACGIAYYGKVSNDSSPTLVGCENNGKIYARGDNYTAYASGISSSFGNGIIRVCKNNGDITAISAADQKSYAAGVVIFSYWVVQASENHSTVTANGGETYSAGICGISYVQALYCVNDGNVTANGVTSYVGGIIALSDVANVNYQGGAGYCINKGTLTCSASSKGQIGGIIGMIKDDELEVATLEGKDKKKVAGFAISSYNLGEINANENCLAGKIVGVCVDTAHVEDRLKDNYCLTNDMTVIGQIYTSTEDGEEYESGDNFGARTLTAEGIEQLDEYKKVLKYIENINASIFGSSGSEEGNEGNNPGENNSEDNNNGDNDGNGGNGNDGNGGNGNDGNGGNGNGDNGDNGGVDVGGIEL